MTFLASIRSKIWLCVLVALAGYFIATVCGFYSNLSQFHRLSRLERVYFPWSSLASDLFHTFKKQTERYEDAFLTGEKELALQGNLLIPEILSRLDKMEETLSPFGGKMMLLTKVRELRALYQEYSRTAAVIYPRVAEVESSLELQREIQRLGRSQRKLLEGFAELDDQMSRAFVKEIEQDKAKSLYSIFFLGALFVLVLFAVAIIVDRVANRLLVQPLTRIRENLHRFSMFQEVAPLGVTNPNDEIGKLEAAFQEMTERLKSTTVSKKYVDNIIRNMTGGLVVTTPQGTIQKVNQQALELFEYQEEELVNQPINLLVDTSKEGGFLPCHRLTQGEPVKSQEILCRTRSGRVFPAHFSGSAMHDDQGRLTGFVCIFNDITELKNAEARLKQMALYDALTGAANRNLFFEHLEMAIRTARREGGMFALLYLDLDDFKPINDQKGHDAGDLVLKQVVLRLKRLIREQDTVARVGGDEFIVLLNGLHSPDDARLVAGKIISELTRPFTDISPELRIGVSIGISIFPLNGTQPDVLMSKADQAMYDAKAKGGNCACRFQEKGPVQPDLLTYVNFRRRREGTNGNSA